MKLWETDSDGKSSDLAERVEDFTASEDVKYDEKLADYDILGSLAHVQNLEDIGILSSKEADELRKGLLELLDREINLTSADEDIHTRIESLLTEDLGEVGEKLHTGRSRNDQILVDLRLFAKDKAFDISRLLVKAAREFCSFAKEFDQVPMVGYTHTRKAMPSSVGMWGCSFAEAFLEDLQLLKAVLDVMDRSPLGAGAGYGLPLPLNRELSARVLGFSGIVENPLYAVSSRGKMEFQLLSALSGVHMDLARLSTDLIFFSGEEFDFFEIPDDFTTGSSIMPQKKNPDVLEILRGKSRGYLSYLTEIYSSCCGLISGYNRDQQTAKSSLMEGVETTEECLEMVVPLVEGLKVNEEGMREGFTEEILATDEAVRLVDQGVPFRKAYRRVKRDLEEGSFGKSKKEVEEALKDRVHRGGTARLGLDKIEERLEEKESFFQDKREEFQESLGQLVDY